MKMKAWVVFSGKTELPWLRFLKKGYRHCYVILHDGQRWMSLDALSHMTEMSVYHHLPSTFELPAWLEGRGMRVVAAPMIAPVPKCLPPSLYSCVESVKRILGIRRYTILTPYQLYTYLMKESKNHGKSCQNTQAADEAGLHSVV